MRKHTLLHSQFTLSYIDHYHNLSSYTCPQDNSDLETFSASTPAQDLVRLIQMYLFQWLEHPVHSL